MMTRDYHSQRRAVPVRVFLNVSVLIAMLVPLQYAHANEQQLNINLQSLYQYTDNAFFSPSDKEALSGSFIVPSFYYSNSNGRYRAQATGSASVKRYNNDDFNTNSNKINITLSEHSPTSYWSSALTHSEQTIRGFSVIPSELSDDVISVDELTSDDLTQVINRPVTTASAQFNGHKKTNERNTLGSALQYVDKNYEGERLTDYEYFFGNYFWRRQLSSRTGLQVQVLHSDYRPASIFIDEQPDLNTMLQTRFDSRSKSIGVKTGIMSQVTENFFATLLVGSTTLKSNQERSVYLNANRIDESKTQQSQTTSLFDISLKYQLEKNLAQLKINRNTEASASGYVQNNETIELQFNHTFNKKYNLTHILRHTKIEAIHNALETNRDNRAFSSATLSFRHNYSNNWNFISSLQYRQQRYENLTQNDTEETIVLLRLEYRKKTSL